MTGRFIKPIISKNVSDEVDGDIAEEEPLSPVARIFQSTRLYCPIIYLLASKTLIDVDAIKFGLNDSFVKHPRFSSLLVTNDKNGGQMSWRRTEVDIHNHVHTPELDPNMESPDTFVEDYVSNLTNTGLDPAKPLWELHVLNVQTSDASATAVLKYHHSIGDGVSFISLLLASSRKASDFKSMPSLPKPKRPTSFWNNRHGFWGPIFTICTMILMAFNTFVDMMHLAATALFFKDTDTPMKGVPEITINDVLLGITMAALSRYLNRRYAPGTCGYQKEQEVTSKTYNNLPANIRLRSTMAFNIRPYPGTLPLADMMKKEAKVRWGNPVSVVLIPITIALLDDPLDYVRKAKAVVDRKKLSFEAISTYSLGRFALKLFGHKLPVAVSYRVSSNTTMTFSNIVGPQEEISFYGHHLSYIAPSAYGQPQALTLHWQSYGDKIVFVLTVDPDVIPDYNNLCADFEASLKLIKDAVIQSGVAVAGDVV